MDGVSMRELEPSLPAYYRDVRGLIHACEIEGDAPGELFVRTLCNRDVPPKRVFISETPVAVTCEDCLVRRARR
jgi:hypothetical protein